MVSEGFDELLMSSLNLWGSYTTKIDELWCSEEALLGIAKGPSENGRSQSLRFMFVVLQQMCRENFSSSLTVVSKRSDIEHRSKFLGVCVWVN